MERLIDAEKVYELGHRTPFHIGIADLCDLKELLADVPTVDAVPVVRCKECKRCFKHTTKRNKQNMWMCMRNEMEVFVRPDDFCSYGERKDGD